jgi:hypothetical protein
MYFWFLNSDCSLSECKRHIKAFADQGAAGVVLHPRYGQVIPYISADWFEMIKEVVTECRAAGLIPWLYDEDYCPSGNAGGIIIHDNLDWVARKIVRSEADTSLKKGELFFMPYGKVLWAGLVPKENGKDGMIDLTAHVGSIKRHWEAAEWDSKWYYPATPLYPAPRANATYPEMAMLVPDIPDHMRLVSFVARPLDDFTGLLNIDSLNRDATDAFIASTYDAYAEHLGDMLGTDVPAIFTDEPKYLGNIPYSSGMLDDFADEKGYRLEPRLEELFSYKGNPAAMKTRIDMREFLGNRFMTNWLHPIADWCESKGVHLVGHISPEDDPIQQVSCVSNLLPLQKSFSLSGLDLILPATGDRDHPLLNVGVTMGTSTAQQNNKPGVMCEMLGCSGLRAEAAITSRIICWQVMAGVSAPVIHAAHLSTLGMRRLEAPPDFGPDSPVWESITETNQFIRKLMPIVTDSRQNAPVAILWPIRSYMADIESWIQDDSHAGRRDFVRLLQACNEAQVGVHIVDETELWDAETEDGLIRIGKARYSHLLISPIDVLHARSMDTLQKFVDNGVVLKQFGDAASYLQSDDGLQSIQDGPWETVTDDNWENVCKETLPRIVQLTNETPSLRVTAWERDDATTLLMMNLSDHAVAPEFSHGTESFDPWEIKIAEQTDKGLTVIDRLKPNDVTPETPDDTIPVRDWSIQLDDEACIQSDAPQAVYMFRTGNLDATEIVPLMLTGKWAAKGAPVAETAVYKTTLPQPGILLVEPTLVRGDVTVSCGDVTWSGQITDTDLTVTEIDLTQCTSGDTLTFQFKNPDPFDGIKWPPRLRI